MTKYLMSDWELDEKTATIKASLTNTKSGVVTPVIMSYNDLVNKSPIEVMNLVNCLWENAIG